MKKNFVMTFGAIGRSIFYRSACRCTSQECDITLEMEADKKFNLVSLYLYKTLKASAHYAGPDGYWDYFDFIRVFINKIKMMWKILTAGYIEVDESFMFEGDNHIDEFLTALETGRRFFINKEEEVKNETDNT